MKLNKLYLATSSLALLYFSPAAIAQQESRIQLSGAVMQSWQAGMEVEGAAADPGNANADSGFHRFRFAININVQVTERVSVFAELAEEPNDWNDSSAAVSQDLAWIQFQFNDDMGVRLGNLISTTQNFIRYSDGAAVQSNPFVGNSLVDMITAEEGLWFYGVHNTANDHSITWDAVVSTPDFFADFTDGRGYNYGLRGTYNLPSGLSFGGGMFSTNHDIDAVTGKTAGTLIAVGDGDNYQFASSAPNARVTHPLIVPGVDAFIWQADVQYKTDTVLLHGLFGSAKDDYSWADGQGTFQTNYIEQDAEMAFWSIEGRYMINEDLYVAARYAESDNESAGISDNNTASRLQLGGGWWMNDSTLFKAEYVKQEEEQYSGGGTAQFGAEGGAEWDGVIIEASVTF
ncbi:hypothetical protein [Alteromonas sp. C1M14]|uniref:hypothetical protein n=1 Tax=Alteromonas sp. C1M14 TaxID=2841567 RepID=UPI001C0A0670|nr:hypothetical protein [Alteromonas sp. C1M14]MBU2978481.1 hypothetical protein [Alteromonas sp. C1M14]